MNQKLCCLVIGHKFDKQGARNNEYGDTEYLFFEKFAHDVQDAFIKLKNDTEDYSPHKIKIIHRESYKTLPTKVNYFKPDFTISLHANAFNESVSGSEVIWLGQNPKTRLLAELFNDQFKLMKLPNRGVKHIIADERGGYLLSRLKSSAIITEPFFIDNSSDLEYVKSGYDYFVRLYVDAILKAFYNIF